MIEKQPNLTNILNIFDLTNRTTRSINLLGLEGLVGIMRLTGFMAQKLLDSYIYMYVYIHISVLEWIKGIYDNESTRANKRSP